MYELDKINATTNEFDRMERLHAFKSIYKKSDFYKHTKMPLQKAFQWYTQIRIEKVATKLTNIFNGESLMEVVVNAIDDIEPETIENLFNKLIEAFDPTKLDDQQQKLKELINKVQP